MLAAKLTKTAICWLLLRKKHQVILLLYISIPCVCQPVKVLWQDLGQCHIHDQSSRNSKQALDSRLWSWGHDCCLHIFPTGSCLEWRDAFGLFGCATMPKTLRLAFLDHCQNWAYLWWESIQKVHHAVSGLHYWSYIMELQIAATVFQSLTQLTLHMGSTSVSIQLTWGKRVVAKWLSIIICLPPLTSAGSTVLESKKEAAEEANQITVETGRCAHRLPVFWRCDELLSQGMLIL